MKQVADPSGYVQESRGNLSLTMVFSTAAGLLFVMLFYNLVQYVGARAAVKEAARKAARCVSPTDPECVARNSAPEQLLQEWFGYPANQDGDRVLLSLDHYRYLANMTTISWGGEFTTWEIHRAKQPVSWTEYEVPVLTFRPRYVIPEGRISTEYRAEYFTERYQPNFPEFTQDTSLTPEQWLRISHPGFRPLLLGRRIRIEPGKEVEIVTREVDVPEIPGAVDANCYKADGGPCDSATPAGEAFDAGSWRNNGFLAIKAFSQLRSLGEGSEVKWGKELPDNADTSGLYVEIFENGEWHEVCLGGRTYVSVGEDWVSNNLWLRGPADAHGGSHPSCPGGKRIHDKIRVPRGGKFRVRGYLRAQAGGDPVEGYVSIYYYLDEYEKRQEIIDCPEVSFRGDPELVQCTPLEQCEYNPQRIKGKDSSFLPASEYRAKCEGIIEAVSTACREGENTVRSAGVSGKVKTVTAAVCDDSWRPKAPGTEIDSGDTRSCDWEIVPGKEESVRVPGVLRGKCPLAKTINQEQVCEHDPIYGEGKDWALCKNVFAAIASREKEAKELNDRQPDGAPSFTAQIQPKWEDLRDDYWEFSWIPVDQVGNVLPESRNQVRKIQSPIAERYLVTTYKREGSVQDKPTPGEFLETALEQSAGSKASPGWEEYATHPERYIQVRKAGEDTLAIQAGYPFEQAVPEIYWGQNGAGRGWDFDRDCERDLECGDSFQRFEDEKQMLRFYAGKSIPQAADPKYLFSFKKEYQETETFPMVQTRADAEGIEFQPCTPTKMICETTPGQGVQRVFLGVHEKAPAVCTNGTYRDCYAVSVADSYVSPEQSAQIDQTLAARKAMDEIKRVIPFAHLEEQCTGGDGSGCTAVTLAFEGGRVRATVDYQMPLSFPLNTILGRETIPIEYTQEEVMEYDVISLP